MTEPEIRAVTKLSLEPGDILVITMPRDRLSAQRANNILNACRGIIPASVRVVFAEEGTNFSVIRPEGQP